MGKMKKSSSGRVAGGFIALPWAVTDCPNYKNLSYTARALLIEVARQYVRDNNGRLLMSMRYLKTRGWTSSDVVNRAKKELIAGGFIHETVKGRRPNRASWYAITWQKLDLHKDYDFGAERSFRRSAYEPPIRLVAAAPVRGGMGSPHTPVGAPPALAA